MGKLDIAHKAREEKRPQQNIKALIYRHVKEMEWANVCVPTSKAFTWIKFENKYEQKTK